jgi:RNA polymerase sigma-70 factor, ECF subfamily
MMRVDPGRTDPKLLERVKALHDNPTWKEFFDLYGPFVTNCCLASGLDPASVDELCQRIWVELVRRLPAYQYDPGGSFRGWLNRLCQRRTIDMYRERRDHCLTLLGDDATTDTFLMARSRFDLDPADHIQPKRLALLDEAKQIQEKVQRKVKPIRWEIFWRVVIQGEPMPETAAALGLKYSTVYAAVNHVGHLLREEGQRRSARLGFAVSSSS